MCHLTEAFGNGLEEHLEEKTKKDVKEAGAENSNEEEEEEKLIDEMKKELAAEKPKLEDKPIAQQEWKWYERWETIVEGAFAF